MKQTAFAVGLAICVSACGTRSAKDNNAANRPPEQSLSIPKNICEPGVAEAFERKALELDLVLLKAEAQRRIAQGSPVEVIDLESTKARAHSTISELLRRRGCPRVEPLQ